MISRGVETKKEKAKPIKKFLGNWAVGKIENDGKGITGIGDTEKDFVILKKSGGKRISINGGNG